MRRMVRIVVGSLKYLNISRYLMMVMLGYYKLKPTLCRPFSQIWTERRSGGKSCLVIVIVMVMVMVMVMVNVILAYQAHY